MFCSTLTLLEFLTGPGEKEYMEKILFDAVIVADLHCLLKAV